MHLQSARDSVILSVKDGWIACPTCGKLLHAIRISNETTGRALAVRCKTCRTEISLNIDSGQRVYCQRP